MQNIFILSCHSGEKIFALTILILWHALQYFLISHNNRIKGQRKNNSFQNWIPDLNLRLKCYALMKG